MQENTNGKPKPKPTPNSWLGFILGTKLQHKGSFLHLSVFTEQERGSCLHTKRTEHKITLLPGYDKKNLQNENKATRSKPIAHCSHRCQLGVFSFPSKFNSEGKPEGTRTFSEQLLSYKAHKRQCRQEEKLMQRSFFFLWKDKIADEMQVLAWNTTSASGTERDSDWASQSLKSNSADARKTCALDWPTKLRSVFDSRDTYPTPQAMRNMK